MTGEIVWLNGRVVHIADARISPFDRGLLTGDGVFETLRVYRGVPFAARRHLERLAASAAGLGLPPPDGRQLRWAMDEVIVANGIVDGRLRITFTAGPAPLGPKRGDDGARPTVIVAAGALDPWPPAVDVVVVPWPRSQRSAVAGIKTISYAENVRARAYADERGAGEAIFPNLSGDLCEGTGTNVFVARHGRVVTPTLASGCLPGVTRKLVIELIDAVEQDVPLATLYRADEAFLTSSTRQVQPIRSVDGVALPHAPGPLTDAAAAAFAALVERDLDP